MIQLSRSDGDKADQIKLAPKLPKAFFRAWETLVEAMEDLMVGTVRDTARKSVMSVYRDRFTVVAAQLGDDAGVLGACAWAKQEITKNSQA